MSDKFTGTFKPFEYPALELEHRLHSRSVVVSEEPSQVVLYMVYGKDYDALANREEFCEKHPFQKYFVGMSEFAYASFILLVGLLFLFTTVIAFTGERGFTTQNILKSIFMIVVIYLCIFSPRYIERLNHSLEGREWTTSPPSHFTNENSMDSMKIICGCLDAVSKCAHPGFIFKVWHHPRNPTRFLSVESVRSEGRRRYFLASWEKPSEKSE